MGRFCGSFGWSPLANAVEKFGHVFSVSATATNLLAFGWPSFSLRSFVNSEGATAREDHVSFGSIKNIAIVETMHAVTGKGIVFIDQQAAILIFIGYVQIVGVFAGVSM